MARIDSRFQLPGPPAWLTLSPVPDKSIKDAVAWYEEIGVHVTERWLKSVTDRKELVCRIIAGRRYYSTEALWRFIVTRPTRTAGAARYQQKGTKRA
jgi:hypothetical protein